MSASTLGSVIMETTLIIILVCLVALLGGLLLARVRRERREAAALGKMSLPDPSNILGSALMQGDVAEVSDHLFSLLRECCGCDKIVFLNRRNAFLEFSRAHGIDSVDAKQFSLPCTPDLVSHLTRHSHPGRLDEIEAFLSEELRSRLHYFGCEMYLPLLAQNRLNGLYFVSGNAMVRSIPFQLVLASVAQTISAAGQIHLVETERGRLRDRVRELESAQKNPGESKQAPGRLLKLIRHRDSATLVGRIMEEVKSDLGLTRSVFVYPGSGSADPVLISQGGNDDGLKIPRHSTLENLLARLAPDKPEAVATLEVGPEVDGGLVQALKQAGYKYVAEFPLSSARSGLLAFDTDAHLDEITVGLRGYGRSATELMANAESFAEVEALSYTDGLTGLANQRYFKQRLDEEIGRAGRYGRTLALIIFDLDELKSVNDRYGHQAGDSVIEQMGELLKSSVRSIDVVARYGGDEFCIIMPESGSKTCRGFMDRLQRKVSGNGFYLPQLKQEIACTISQGGAVFPDHGDTTEKLIYAADMALLRAKEGGRNQSRLSPGRG